ncbi:DUF2505 domain-containing protein [Mycobacterium parmense]|uniref:Uncharacterized protein n=1 Tax=Mycobacterium parmense TaxID=185642 RepID=A0A7I7YW21_9MYCO|nr:DUF2505 domain-containing protein [Mycobacterium parmense]MCV7350573.1 DUF2505 domain-containing protein [Mycobacterium parmense]ORW48288.1 hypothetical protein AWC20_25430 [Mycobacterium parmense]BBZ46000.1 hypothetical protein MPRM_32810 [Mycobacterium parmense]
MPHSFELSADYEDNAETLYQAFREEDYWLARLADIPVDEAKLDSMRIGGDGTVDVVTLQVVRSHNLHALVKQLHRGDLCVRREETWDPFADGVARGLIAGTIVGTPVDVSGSAELSSTEPGGARLTYRITVKVRIPIIGGKVEKLIGTHLGELVSREQRLTADWIAANA